MICKFIPPSFNSRLISKGLSPSYYRRSSAFTIIELLVVISIIAILIGFALPSFLPTKDIAKQRHAIITAKHLALACNEYCNQNQSWPGKDGNINQCLEKLIGNNPQKVAFFEIGTNTVDNFRDPWGNRYQVAFDDDFDNKIEHEGKTIYKSVIVWSVATNVAGQVITNKSWE